MASPATACSNTSSCSVAVKRIFELQEERKGEYDKLKRAQDSYTGSPDPMLPDVLTQYQSEMGNVTTSLSNISQEFSELMQLLKERGNVLASDIIGRIQEEEKEKLRLVVQYQVMEQTLKTKKNESNKTKEEEEGGDFTGIGDTIRWIPELRELRRKLAVRNTCIADLMEELRFECEDLLTRKA